MKLGNQPVGRRPSFLIVAVALIAYVGLLVASLVIAASTRDVWPFIAYGALVVGLVVLFGRYHVPRSHAAIILGILVATSVWVYLDEVGKRDESSPSPAASTKPSQTGTQTPAATPAAALELRCDAEGSTTLKTPFVIAQPTGLNVDIDNAAQAREPIYFLTQSTTSEGGASSEVLSDTVPLGISHRAYDKAPGVLGVRCGGSSSDHSGFSSFTLVDPSGYYTEVKACGDTQLVGCPRLCRLRTKHGLRWRACSQPTCLRVKSVTSVARTRRSP
jgi:hypothetical protein